jgi:halocyanin-like protein
MTTTDHSLGGNDDRTAADSDAAGRDGDRGLSRRNALRVLGGGVVAGTTLGTVPGATRAQSGGTDLPSWFEGVSNYDGVADRTGTDDVAVDVGVEANGGAFGFGPAAIRVDPGTTVTWSWTGQGGSHNVAATEGAFESELTDSAEYTFEHTFEQAGVYTYACTPHETLGMKGAVVVGDVEVASDGRGAAEATGTPTGGGDGSGDGAGSNRDTDGGTVEPDAAIAAPFDGPDARRLGGLALGGALGVALASPGLFGAFLWLTDGDGADEPPAGDE